MILLLEPAPPGCAWHLSAEGGMRSGRLQEVEGACQRLAEECVDEASLEAVGHLLLHGGTQMTEPVTPLTAGSLPGLQQVVVHLPEHNDITCRLASQALAAFPSVPHYVVCDTAFFTALPAWASQYAVPQALREAGLRRFGGFGIGHQWAWQQVRAHGPATVRRLVSVRLADHTSVAAILDGEPLDTSLGFTGVEGVPSTTGCGDIDPTIPLHLRSSGMTFAEIGRMLAMESGLSALVGRPCHLDEVLRCETADTADACQVFRHALLKHAGGAMAVLGGVDAVAFVCNDPQAYRGFLLRVAGRLDDLGLTTRWETPWHPGGPDGSQARVRLYALTWSRSNAAIEMIRRLMSQEGDAGHVR